MAELLAARRPDLPAPRLELDCPEIFARRRAGDTRAYAHVGHVDGAVCVASDLARRGDNILYGVLLHEVGHLGAFHDGLPPTEKAANDWVERELGHRIVYRGRPPLQWVPLGR